MFVMTLKKTPCIKVSRLVHERCQVSKFKMKKRRERGGIHAEVREEFRKGSYKGSMPWVSYRRGQK
jgi:hypothetical protein